MWLDFGALRHFGYPMILRFAKGKNARLSSTGLIPVCAGHWPGRSMIRYAPNRSNMDRYLNHLSSTRYFDC